MIIVGLFVALAVGHRIIEAEDAFLMRRFFQFLTRNNGGYFFEQVGIFLVQGDALGFSDEMAITVKRDEFVKRCLNKWLNLDEGL
jgi:hypothetical protein